MILFTSMFEKKADAFTTVFGKKADTANAALERGH